MTPHPIEPTAIQLRILRDMKRGAKLRASEYRTLLGGVVVAEQDEAMMRHEGWIDFDEATRTYTLGVAGLMILERMEQQT